MARANQSNPKGSGRQSERRQRDEQPKVAPPSWGEDRRTTDRREEQGASGRRGGTERRRRPDETLAREIREILTADPELDATAIEVEVEDGAVTVLGEVADPQARLLAEELVESVVGVRGVQNRLRVVG